MGRRKLIKEYAIRLIHPELGEWYYHYCNNNYGRYEFFFTQDLNKVLTWKTLKFTNKEIQVMIKNLEKGNYGAHKILLEFGKTPKEELKDKMIISRKKYYYIIKSIPISKFHIENAQNIIDNLDKSLVEDSKNITKILKKNKKSDNLPILINKLSNDIDRYKKEAFFLEKTTQNSGNYVLDIVDASYNFRLLKLRTLKKVQVENDI